MDIVVRSTMRNSPSSKHLVRRCDSRESVMVENDSNPSFLELFETPNELKNATFRVEFSSSIDQRLNDPVAELLQ